MPGLFFRRRAYDPNLPVEELRLGWTILVTACALGAWLTPYVIPWPEALAARPWWAGGKTQQSLTVAAFFLIPGVLLGLAAVRSLGRPRALITDGPYRWVRHPYYLAVLLLLVGAVVAFRSLPAVMLLIPAVRVTVDRARREEHNLRLRFGGRHEVYCRRVPFLLPLAPPLPLGGLDAEAEPQVHLDLEEPGSADRDQGHEPRHDSSHDLGPGRS